MTRSHVSCRTSAKLIAAAALVASALSSTASAEEPAAKVLLNGELSPVYFNDGDSFRVLSGDYRGKKARLAGFNTLESHGPVHQWGTWTAKELYYIAKIATYHSRRGTWTCDSDGKTDTYGRMLAHCPDLAEDLIRHGLAHALSIDDTPSAPALLAAQNEAMKAKRGIWAHGIPEFILTSLHSVEEDVDGKGTYNRLVSTKDGHSIMWKHNREYKECENVCLPVYPLDPSVLPAVTTRLKKEAPELIAKVSEPDLKRVLERFQRIRLVDKPILPEHRPKLQELLLSYAKDGMFGAAPSTPGPCMVHVPFKRRYGHGRAACLKK